MEWMYKEREKKEADSSVKNDLTPNCNPTSDVGDEKVENSGGESIVSDADNPDLVEEHLEGVGNQLSPPALSESDESTTTDTSYQQKNDVLASDQNWDKSLDSSNYGECCKAETKSSMKSEIVPCDDDPSREDISDDEKDEVIKSLREEVVTDTSLYFLSWHLDSF